jgi:Protein of unknown function (DUF3467)
MSRSRRSTSRSPSDVERGLYSNVLFTSHTGYEFTLDFASTQPVYGLDENDDEVRGIPCRVVARIRIPVTIMFDVIRVLNAEMTRYESTFGEIRKPQPQSGDQ